MLRRWIRFRMVAVVVGAFAVLAIAWYFVLRVHVEELCSGRWLDHEGRYFLPGRCVYSDCASDSSCGYRNNALSYCDEVYPGMQWSEVQYLMGEPGAATADGFIYFEVGVDLEVRLSGKRATGFRLSWVEEHHIRRPPSGVVPPKGEELGRSPGEIESFGVDGATEQQYSGGVSVVENREVTGDWQTEPSRPVSCNHPRHFVRHYVR